MPVWSSGVGGWCCVLVVLDALSLRLLQLPNAAVYAPQAGGVPSRTTSRASPHHGRRRPTPLRPGAHREECSQDGRPDSVDRGSRNRRKTERPRCEIASAKKDRISQHGGRLRRLILPAVALIATRPRGNCRKKTDPRNRAGGRNPVPCDDLPNSRGRSVESVGIVGHFHHAGLP